MALTYLTNSYVTEPEADTYFFEERLHNDSWDTDDEDNVQALIQAARLLEYNINWLYEKTDSDQALQWPRTGFADIDTDEIPQAVKYAQMELALELKKDDATTFLKSSGVSYLWVENIGVQINQKQEKQLIPDHVFSFISHLGGRKDGTGTVKRIR